MPNLVIQSARRHYPEYSDLTDDELTLKYASQFPEFLKQDDFKRDYDRITGNVEAPASPRPQQAGYGRIAGQSFISGTQRLVGGIDKLAELGLSLPEILGLSEFDTENPSVRQKLASYYGERAVAHELEARQRDEALNIDSDPSSFLPSMGRVVGGAAEAVPGVLSMFVPGMALNKARQGVGLVSRAFSSKAAQAVAAEAAAARSASVIATEAAAKAAADSSYARTSALSTIFGNALGGKMIENREFYEGQAPEGSTQSERRLAGMRGGAGPGIVHAAIELGMSRLGMKYGPEALLGASVADPIKRSFIATVARHMGFEATEEALTSVLQLSSDKVTSRPDLTFPEAVKEVILSGAVGGLLGVGSGAISGAIPSAAAPVERVDDRNVDWYDAQSGDRAKAQAAIIAAAQTKAKAEAEGKRQDLDLDAEDRIEEFASKLNLATRAAKSSKTASIATELAAEARLKSSQEAELENQIPSELIDEVRVLKPKRVRKTKSDIIGEELLDQRERWEQLQEQRRAATQPAVPAPLVNTANQALYPFLGVAPVYAPVVQPVPPAVVPAPVVFTPAATQRATPAATGVTLPLKFEAPAIRVSPRLPDLEPEASRDDIEAKSFRIVAQGRGDFDGMRGNYGRATILNTKAGEPGWLGNPVRANDVRGGTLTREQATEEFRVAFLNRIENDPEFRKAVLALRGKTVGYYKPSEPSIHLHHVQDWLAAQPATPASPSAATTTAAQPAGVAPGENIASAGRGGSELGQALTNVTYGKFPITKPDLVAGLVRAGLKKPTKGQSAEHWYQANKADRSDPDQDSKDMAVMELIILAKLKQYPELTRAIDSKGGSAWLLSSKHSVFPSPRKRPNGFSWEGSGSDSMFITVLNRAYRKHVGSMDLDTQPATPAEAPVPVHKRNSDLRNKDGSIRYASTNGRVITINPVTDANAFFDYFEGKSVGATSAQKGKVLEDLAKRGYPIDVIKSILNTNALINRFLVFHEQSHIDNGDKDVYWLSGKGLLTPDKIAIEVRATIDALKRLGGSPVGVSPITRLPAVAPVTGPAFVPTPYSSIAGVKEADAAALVEESAVTPTAIPVETEAVFLNGVNLTAPVQGKRQNPKQTRSATESEYRVILGAFRDSLIGLVSERSEKGGLTRDELNKRATTAWGIVNSNAYYGLGIKIGVSKTSEVERIVQELYSAVFPKASREAEPRSYGPSTQELLASRAGLVSDLRSLHNQALVAQKDGTYSSKEKSFVDMEQRILDSIEEIYGKLVDSAYRLASFNIEASLRRDSQSENDATAVTQERGDRERALAEVHLESVTNPDDDLEGSAASPFAESDFDAQVEILRRRTGVRANARSDNRLSDGLEIIQDLMLQVYKMRADGSWLLPDELRSAIFKNIAHSTGELSAGRSAGVKPASAESPALRAERLSGEALDNLTAAERKYLKSARGRASIRILLKDYRRSTRGEDAVAVGRSYLAKLYKRSFDLGLNSPREVVTMVKQYFLRGVFDTGSRSYDAKWAEEVSRAAHVLSYLDTKFALASRSYISEGMSTDSNFDLIAGNPNNQRNAAVSDYEAAAGWMRAVSEAKIYGKLEQQARNRYSLAAPTADGITPVQHSPQLAANLAREVTASGTTAAVQIHHLSDKPHVEGWVEADGSIHLNTAAPSMLDPKNAQRVIREEWAHAALGSPAGQKAMADSFGVLSRSERAYLESQGYRQEAGESDSDYSRRLTDEFIAKHARENTTRWQRFSQYVKQLLAGIGIRNLTESEAASMILKSLNVSPSGFSSALSLPSKVSGPGSLARFLTPTAGLGSKLRDIVDRGLTSIEASKREIADAQRAVEEAVASDFGVPYDQLPPAVYLSMLRVLQHPAIAALSLPNGNPASATLDALYAARATMTRLSARFGSASRSYISEEMSDVIAGNPNYLTRSYRLFEDPRWLENLSGIVSSGSNPEITKAYRAALNSAASNLISEGKDPSYQNSVSRVQRQLATLRDEESDSKKTSIGGLSGGQSASVRVPDFMKVLMGEVKDPIEVIGVTMSNLSGKIAFYDTLHTFAGRAEADGLISKENDNSSHTVSLAVKGTTDPLSEYFTTPEFHGHVNELRAKSQEFSPLLEYLATITRASKLFQTAGNLGFTAQQVFGNTISLIQSGHYTSALGLPRAVYRVLRDRFGKTEALAREEYTKLVRLGLIGNNQMNPLTRHRIADAANGIPLNEQLEGISKIRGTVDNYLQILSSVDNAAKALAFYAEVDAITAGYANAPAADRLSSTEIDELAATRVRERMPSYSRVPLVLKNLDYVPLFGNFTIFAYLSSYNLVKNIQYTMLDLKNPYMRSHGLKSLSGLATTAAIASPLLLSALGAVLGEATDDEKQEFLDARKAYDKEKRWVIYKDGSAVKGFSLDSLDPMSNMSKAASAIYKGVATEASLYDAALKSVSQVLSPMLQEGKLSKVWGDILDGEDSSHRRIWEETDDNGTKLSKSMLHVGSQIFTPASFRKFADQIYPAMVDGEQQRGRSSSWQMLLVGEATATSPQKLNRKQAALGQMRQLMAEYRKLGAESTRYIMSRDNLTQVQADIHYDNFLAKREKAFNQASISFRRLVKNGGFTDAEVRKLSDEADFGIASSRALMSGVYVKPKFSLENQRDLERINEARRYSYKSANPLPTNILLQRRMIEIKSPKARAYRTYRNLER